MTKVSITKCPAYRYEDVLNAVRKSVDLIGGMKNFVKKNDKVLLKINQLQAADPKRATTTHPTVTQAVIELVREAGGKPTIGDSPGFGSLKSVAQKTGIEAVAKKTKTPLIEFDTPVEMEVPEGKIVKRFEIEQKLADFDLIINMPKLKSHTLTTFTGGVKNLYGCIPGKLKAYQHVKIQDPVDFSDMILDLYLLIKPKLTIMDGIIGMDGQGPNAGNPKEIGIIISGEDSLAVDTVAVNVVGLTDTPMMQQAKKRGLDQGNISKIEVLGKTIKSVHISDFEHPKPWSNSLHFLARFAKGAFTSKPVVVLDLCIGCGACEKACPKDAIHMKKKKKQYKSEHDKEDKPHKKGLVWKKNALPSFDYSECIRCFCCSEICPKKAIIVRPTGIIRFFTTIKRIFMK